MKPIGSILTLFIAATNIDVMRASGRAAEPTTAPAVVSRATLIQRANADAVSRLYAQIAAETVGGVPVAQIIDRVEGHTIMMNGLAKAEQVGGPRVVCEDLIQVQLQISGPRAVQLVLQAVSVKPINSPISPDRLAYLLKEWNPRVFTSTGGSLPPSADAVRFHATTVTTSSTTTSAPRLADLKLDAAPLWTNGPIVSRATAEKGPSALRTARDAETAAREMLRSQIEWLLIEGDIKIGDVAKADEALRGAVDDTVDAARIAGVDYHSNGSVEVRIALDGNQLWQAILASR